MVPMLLTGVVLLSGGVLVLVSGIRKHIRQGGPVVGGATVLH